MVEQDDDSFLKDFMARAQMRQAKLAQIKEPAESEPDVSYPPLSPLQEESHLDETSSIYQHKQEQHNTHHKAASTITSGGDYDGSVADDKAENVSPDDDDDSQHNYSSDLSLDYQPNEEIHRAEPVVWGSSPEQVLENYRIQLSPRKVAPSAPKISTQSSHSSDYEAPSAPPPVAVMAPPEPLHERQPEQKSASSQSLPTTARVTETTLKDLEIKANRAEQTRKQLKKVVDISKYGSKEHVEAAKLFQIAEAEHLNYTKHVAMYRQGVRRRTECLGSIKITNIRLKISSKLRNDLAEETVSHYFFCIATCGPVVKATEILDTNDIRRQDLKAYLEFKEKISFVDLTPEFVIKVEVFELVTGQHLPKLLSRLTPSKKTKMTYESHFKRVGSLKLGLQDREVSYKNLVQWSKLEESKYIERECKFQMELKPEQLPSKAGMLHVRCLSQDGQPDWSRFWVDLSNGKIRFWNSKLDALDGKKPNQILEFNDLCSQSVQKLGHDDDLYRQNSFVLYSYQQLTGGERETLFQRFHKENEKFKIVKHQLATENKEERDSWCSIIDKALQSFREWHGKNKVYSLAELNEIFSTPL